jgi:two-component system response regulator FixJ
MTVVPNVFIVDDEPLVRKALKQSIESLSARAVCFPTPQSCLEALRTEQCDLLITDIHMPEMDGVELLGRVREVAPLVPVVMITGFGSIPLAVRTVQMGAADFIEKPLDEEQLFPKLQKLLEPVYESNDHRVTLAEQKVLDLIIEGKANKEIAFLIGRSIRTVENHRHRLMKKLGVSSTAELVKVGLMRRR